MSTQLKLALSRYISAYCDGDGVFTTPIEGLHLFRSSCEEMPNHVMYRPAICLVVQGAKQVVIGDDTFDYGEDQQLVVSVEMPAIGRVTKASPQAPFLSIALEFDIGALREIMEQLSSPPTPTPGVGLGIFVETLDDRLADCMVRLLRLLETPEAIEVLYPLIFREICYWMLTGPNGGEICKMVLPNSQTQRVSEAIYLLRENFAKPIRIEQLAEAARMSPSSFHQHFKALTSMTPLQYQKHLRLLEARRLMLTERTNVLNAAYQVGYESASHFSREYSRMFGAAPRRDVTELRTASA